MRNNLRPLILMQLGFTMVSAILVPLALGLWFDSSFGTAPWGILCGMGLGVMAGTYGVWRLVSRAIDETINKPDDK